MWQGGVETPEWKMATTLAPGNGSTTAGGLSNGSDVTVSLMTTRLPLVRQNLKKSDSVTSLLYSLALTL